MEDCKGMYEQVCKDRFDRMEKMQQTAIDLLRGQNGNPGLLDDMRAVKATHRRMAGGLIFVVGAITINAIHALWIWLSVQF